jgi:hypothetical protein
MEQSLEQTVKRFLDEEGKVKQLPSKRNMRGAVLLYMHAKFEEGKDYTEKEVNAIITEWSTIGDYFLLRRELIDSRLLGRTANGSRYWKNPVSADSGEETD